MGLGFAQIRHQLHASDLVYMQSFGLTKTSQVQRYRCPANGENNGEFNPNFDPVADADPADPADDADDHLSQFSF